jgi:hypothetical protein
MRPQHTDMWCWAASSQMCLEFLGGTVIQCDEADHQFTRSDCCNNPVPIPCILGGWPEFDHYGFSADITNDAALSWNEIKEQICRKKPIAFTWHWTGSGGHMMVLHGYQVIAGVEYVAISDPLPVDNGDQRLITYEEYVSGSTHTHWNDYYNITKK